MTDHPCPLSTSVATLSIPLHCNMSKRVSHHKVTDVPRRGFSHVVISRKKTSRSNHAVHTILPRTTPTAPSPVPEAYTPRSATHFLSLDSGPLPAEEECSPPRFGKASVLFISNNLPTNPSKTQNDFLREQQGRLHVWMEDIVAREGRVAAATCTGCSIVEGSWRCLDCLGRQIYCTTCFRARHRCHPFHRVEHWTGSFFKAAWLCQTGLEMHLGHGGFECPSVGMVDVSRYHTGSDNGDVPAQDEFDSADIELDNDDSDGGSSCEDGDSCLDDDTCIMGDGDGSGAHSGCRMTDLPHDSGLPTLEGGNVVVFVDVSGVHRLRVHCCQCPNSKTVDRQFVDMGLLPASVVRPKTAFTFRVLDDFRVTNLECHTAGTSYWHKLERKTSNMFPSSVPVHCCITQDLQGLTIATRITIRR